MRNVATSGKRIGYGWLYNWYAVTHASQLAPDGWRVPSDAEWTAMADHLIATHGHITSSTVGGALKSTRNEWLPPNTGATDEFLFSVFPNGWRLPNTGFAYLRAYGFFWTATEGFNTPWGAYGISFYYLNNALSTMVVSKTYGRGVRCIQDKSVGESDGDTGTLTDIEGNIYRWVVIGDYRWMAENLRTTKYRNGNTIPEITDNTDWGNDTTGARCAYNNDHYFVYPPNI